MWKVAVTIYHKALQHNNVKAGEHSKRLGHHTLLRDFHKVRSPKPVGHTVPCASPLGGLLVQAW